MKKVWKWLRLYLILCGIAINLFVVWMLAGWPVFVDRWVTVSQEPHKADAIVCLAEGLTGNNLPSEQGWRGIIAAYALYTDGWAEKVIFSGGGVNQTSEGEVYAEAATWFERTLVYEATNANTWARLGEAYWCAEDKNKARIAYEQALLLNPDNPVFQERLTIINGR